MRNFEATLYDENFTSYDKLSDINKDSDGKGTQERFAEVWAAELDYTNSTYIEPIPANIIVPKTRLDKFVGYAETELGYHPTWIWFFGQSMPTRKNITAITSRLLQIRCTLQCLEVMFAWLGITLVLTEDLNYYGGFDNPLVTLDSTLRTLDTFTDGNVPYDVALTGPVVTLPISVTIDAASIWAGIYTFLLCNQTANTILTAITYNGDDIAYIIAAYNANNDLRTDF